jgi:hypothetical protein
MGVRTLLVRRELDQAAAPPLRFVDRPGDHDRAEPGAAPGSVDPNPFDLRSPAPEAGQARDQGQLEHPGRRAVHLGYDQELVRVRLDRLPG